MHAGYAAAVQDYEMRLGAGCTQIVTAYSLLPAASGNWAYEQIGYCCHWAASKRNWITEAMAAVRKEKRKAAQEVRQQYNEDSTAGR